MSGKRPADELLLKHDGGKFIKAMKDNARFGKGLRSVLRQNERDIAVMRGEIRLATIHPTRAQIPHREVIYANFLAPGPHWRRWPTSCMTPNQSWWLSGSESRRASGPPKQQQLSERPPPSGAALLNCLKTSPQNSSMPVSTARRPG